MDKQSKHYFKILNHDLFGGEGSEGYVSLKFSNKEVDSTLIPLRLFNSDTKETIKYIELSEQEYLEATEEHLE